MTDSILAAAIVIVIAYVFMRASLWWYDRRMNSQRERIRGQQYRLFALRDRALRLVAENRVSPEDADWNALYEHLNESAKLPNVENMQNSHDYALALLTKSPPCAAGEFRKVIPELQQLWEDYKRTVIDICKRGIVDDKRAPSEAVRKKLKKEHKEAEAENFEKWQPANSKETASSCL